MTKYHHQDRMLERMRNPKAYGVNFMKTCPGDVKEKNDN